MAEISSRQVEEVNDQKHLTQPEVRAAPQVNSTEPKEVVHDFLEMLVNWPIYLKG